MTCLIKISLRLSFAALLGIVGTAPLCGQVGSGEPESVDHVVSAGDHLPAVPAFDAEKSLKLENDGYLVEVSRAQGTITPSETRKPASS